MKRQRGRGRKPGNSANRSYESNGPEVKIRGNASQIYDKYMQLARDSSLAGDRVRAENLYQHAEHYLRIVQLNQPKRDPNQDDDQADNNVDEDEDGNQAQGGQNHGNGQDRNDRNDRQSRGRGRNNRNRNQGGRDHDRDNQAERDTTPESENREDPLGVVTPEGDAPSAATTSDAPKEAAVEGEEPRRRTRRPRRTKAEMEAARAAEAALKTASASADDGGSDKTGGDGPESEAAA